MQLGHLAYVLAKSINVTSVIITAMVDEMGEIRKSVLQNCVLIDYLLLRLGHGCMDLTHITNSNIFGYIWPFLTFWLPDFGWLKMLFIGIFVVIIIGIISCICVKSLSLCELCFC